jgi:hypothetical protein
MGALEIALTINLRLLDIFSTLSWHASQISKTGGVTKSHIKLADTILE